MSICSCCSDKTKSLLAGFFGVLGSFLIVGVLAWLLVRKADVGPVDLARAEFRRKALGEIRSVGLEAITSYKVEDANKGWYRLPVARGMEIVAEEWKDATAGRAKLLERYENSQKKVSFE